MVSPHALLPRQIQPSCSVGLIWSKHTCYYVAPCFKPFKCIPTAVRITSYVILRNSLAQPLRPPVTQPCLLFHGCLLAVICFLFLLSLPKGLLLERSPPSPSQQLTSHFLCFYHHHYNFPISAFPFSFFFFFLLRHLMRLGNF